MENRIRDIFIQCLVFNKTIIPLTFVGYELMIADLSESSYPMRVHGISVNHTLELSLVVSPYTDKRPLPSRQKTVNTRCEVSQSSFLSSLFCWWEINTKVPSPKCPEFKWASRAFIRISTVSGRYRSDTADFVSENDGTSPMVTWLLLNVSEMYMYCVVLYCIALNWIVLNLNLRINTSTMGT